MHAMPIEPPKSPGNAGKSHRTAAEVPPGNPRPEVPPPMREPGETPQPEELPGKMPDELPVRGPQGRQLRQIPATDRPQAAT